MKLSLINPKFNFSYDNNRGIQNLLIFLKKEASSFFLDVYIEDLDRCSLMIPVDLTLLG